MNDENEIDLPVIGYLYHYPTLNHPTDKFRLDVYISSIPTEAHFDVLHVILNTESQYGGLERLKISHPWGDHSQFRVCAGKVILEDRKDKKDEAFCFGGQLTINVKKSLTECILVSPAPIIENNETKPMQDLFIVELEILLAEYQAELSDEIEYEKRLCAADPIDLYYACLIKIIEIYNHRTYKNDINMQLLNYLRQEKCRLEKAGLLKDQKSSLDKIFAK